MRGRGRGGGVPLARVEGGVVVLDRDTATRVQELAGVRGPPHTAGMLLLLWLLLLL